MHWSEAFGYVAAVCTFASFMMKTMIPLRVIGLSANLFFIAYGLFGGHYPVLVLHALLLPMNAARLYEMQQLVRKVSAASRDDLSMDWLKPFMTKHSYRAGDILFRKGEPANGMYYVITGRFRLHEIGVEVEPGQLIGELGLLSPDQRRTQTFECLADGDALTITYSQVKQLYFQNPQFGFYFLQLATGRLFRDVERLEQELAKRSPDGAPAAA
jgi:CRP/FNR family cyclic AMP-dependent transcriptional regulator